MSMSISTRREAKTHRRHASDPFSVSRSFLAPLSDADMNEFLEAEDLFMSGHSLPSFDLDLNIPSPRTPGRKHRRTTSEPLLGGTSLHDFAPEPLGGDQLNGVHPLMLDDGLLDSFALDIVDDMDVAAPGSHEQAPLEERPGATLPGSIPLAQLGAAAAAAAKPPKRGASGAAARSRGAAGGAKPRSASGAGGAKPHAKPKHKDKAHGARDKDKDDDKARKYKCSRCGQIKANHVCPYVLQVSVAVASQADPSVTISTMGEKTLSARPRSIS